MMEDISQAKQAGEKLQESEEKLRHLASQLFTAQEDERKRISRELHDELGQALLVLKLQTRAIEGDLQPEQQQLREECLEMLGNLDQVVDNVRRLSRDLSPTLLEDLGLSAALRHLITEFGKHYQIKYSLQETNIDDLVSPADPDRHLPHCSGIPHQYRQAFPGRPAPGCHYQARRPSLFSDPGQRQRL